jgi:hypothetical protein
LYTALKYIKQKELFMPAKKAKTTKKSNSEVSPITAGAAVLFAGAAVTILGIIQNQDNVKLLLVGLGSALLVLGGVILGLAIKPSSKKR